MLAVCYVHCAASIAGRSARAPARACCVHVRVLARNSYKYLSSTVGT